MKKILLIIFGAGASVFGFAQTNYQKSLAQNVERFNTAKDSDDFEKLTNNFAQLTGVQERDWHAFYYTATTLLRNEISLNASSQTHGAGGVAAVAEKYMAPIISNEANNLEIIIVQGFIEYFKLKANAGSPSAFLNYVVKAEQLDANNPRVLLLRGIYEFSNKNFEKASQFLQKSRETFASKAPNTLEPTWGKDEAEYFLSAISKSKN